MSPVDYMPFAPANPTQSGEFLTVSTFLENIPYVQRTVEDLAAQRFLADMIYGTGPGAPSGAIQFDQVTASDLYLSRDVKPIRPGAEFPVLDDQIPTPLVAATTNWGGRVWVTDTDIRRNRVDVLRRALTKLRNTIVRKVDTVAIATLDAAPILTYAFSGVWSNSGTDIFAGLTAAKLLVDQLDMGYELDTLIINPAQNANMLSRSDIRTAFGPQAQEDIVRGASVGRILNLDVYFSNRIPAGTGRLLQRGIVGGISDERALYATSYPEKPSEKTWIQGGREFVPYVTDPKACVKLTGL